MGCMGCMGCMGGMGGLRFLRGEDGLITEAEFEAKRQVILNEKW